MIIENIFCTGSVITQVKKHNLNNAESKGMYCEKILLGKWGDESDFPYIYNQIQEYNGNYKKIEEETKKKNLCLQFSILDIREE